MFGPLAAKIASVGAITLLVGGGIWVGTVDTSLSYTRAQLANHIATTDSERDRLVVLETNYTHIKKSLERIERHFRIPPE